MIITKPIIEHKTAEYESKKRGYGFYSQTIFPLIEIGDFITYIYWTGSCNYDTKSGEVISFIPCSFMKRDDLKAKNCKYCPGYIEVKNENKSNKFCFGVNDEWTVIIKLEKRNERKMLDNFLLSNEDLIL